MGSAWHDAGKGLLKENSFLDFIACAEHLIEQGYTTPSRLAISGASAGGLLVAAVIDRRPDLFGAVLADFPFVDVLNTLLDDTAFSLYDREEFGDPHDVSYYKVIKSYSPYENVGKKRYPAMLVTSGFHDARVRYWEPAKWVARLRHEKIDENQLLLRTRMDAGHFGSSDIYSRIRDFAFQCAFLFDVLQIENG